MNRTLRAGGCRENEYGDGANYREDDELVPQVPGNHRLVVPHVKCLAKGAQSI